MKLKQYIKYISVTNQQIYCKESKPHQTKLQSQFLELKFIE